MKVKNNYVIPIISPDKSIFDKKIEKEKIKLEIKLPNISHLKKAYLFSTDNKNKKEIDFEKGIIKIILSNHKTASLILLSEK